MGLPLTTHRVVLRPLRLEDAEALHEVWGDPETMRFITAGPSVDLEHTRRRIRSQIESLERDGFSLLAVVERDTERVIGDCGLIRDEDRSVELAYRLHRSRWGRGLATEASRAVVAWARTLGLAELVAYTEPDNAASRRVLEKVGFEEAGTKEYLGVPNAFYTLTLT